MSRLTIFTKKDQKVATWSGGTTTQLFIFPVEAEYQKRNFLFRISTATVEIETSEFTSLPGFQRKLMILNGELIIEHKDRYSKHLKKFEQDEFDGGWTTSAKGKVTDFNLMMASGAHGSLEHMHGAVGQEFYLDLSTDGSTGIYLVAGKVEILSENKTASTGDYISVEEPGFIRLKVLETCDLVLVSLTLPKKGA